MTEGEKLLVLAERVEAATAADRELDALIFCAINPGEGWEPDAVSGVKRRIRPNGSDYRDPFRATMSLADEAWEVATLWDRDERSAFAAVGPNAVSGFALGEGRTRGLNATDTLARAITAASLRARALGQERA